MKSAPAVEYPVGRSFWGVRIEAALAVAWLLAQMLWWNQGAGGAWVFSFLLGLVLLMHTVWCWRHAAQGRLEWRPPDHGVGHSGVDGVLQGAWFWHSHHHHRGTRLERVEWMLDLQSRVLLRLRTSSGMGLWIWLERHSDPQRWSDVRRALVAHRRAFQHRP